MKIFVGLGNPGEEYANTYHNAGWLALAELTPANLPLKTHKKLFEYAETDDAVFVWPLTFMNESGKAVREVLKKFKAKPEDLVVFQDDSDLTVGTYKLSFARSSAGHKGVQSIINTLKTNAFERVRIGIRPARERQRQKASEFALKKITSADRKALNSVFVHVVRDMSAPRSRNLSSTRS